MSLLQGLGLLGLLGIPIIILIYLLKSKYTQKPVSSTFIWHRSLRYIKTRLPINFTVSLLLILQLLMVILASLALARPTIIPFTTKDTIIILDSSASMKTISEDGKTRYEHAIEKLQRESEKAGDNHKFTLINAGTKAEALTIRTSTKADVSNAINDTACEDGSPDIDGALELANNVQNINPDAKIYFYTDKSYVDQYGVEVVDFSKDEDINVGLTTFTDMLMGGKYIFNATLNNFSQKELAVTVKFLIDTEVDGVYNPTEQRRNEYILAPDSKQIVTFANSETNVVEGNTFFQIDKISNYECVKIEIECEEDGLLTDNSRTIFCATEKRVKILIVSKDVIMSKTEDGQEIANQNATTFLVAAVRVLGYSLSNKTDIKNKLSQVNNGGAIEGYDLYIFDGVMPSVLPDDGAVWFINPPEDPVGTSIRLIGLKPIVAQVGKPYYFIPEVESDSDIYKIMTKNIGGDGTRKIAVGQFQPIEDTSGNYESIFSCEGNGINRSVLLAGRENNVRVVCLSMDLHKTNLVMQIDFPMLIRNMINYSLPSVVSDRSYEVGQTIKFNAPVGSTNINFKYEDTILDSMEAFDAEFDLEKIGTYSIEVEYENGDIKHYMLPTNVPADESDIVAGGESVVALGVTTTMKLEADPMEIWPYLAMAILALAIIEWGVYYRDEF